MVPGRPVVKDLEGAMLAFEIIAEQRIREAIERGEFDRLPGAALWSVRIEQRHDGRLRLCRL